MSRFDELTEGERERRLMKRIRGGEVSPEDLDAHLLPFFVKIQLQTTSRCNGRCGSCPYPATRETLPQGEMSEALFAAIVEQLAGRGLERTSLFLMNEPLLDRRLERFTAMLKQAVPETRALIFTNGLLLTGRRVVSLAEAGMDEINISVNGFDPRDHERFMEGVDFDRVLGNLRAIGRLARAGDLGGMRLKVVGLQPPGTPDDARRFEEETGLSVYLKPLTNRAGLVDTGALGNGVAPGNPARPPARQACQRPFVKAYVLFNGDMLLCNCDWLRTTVIGNVERQPLASLWNSPRLMEIRRAQITGAFPDTLPCVACDYPYRL